MGKKAKRSSLPENGDNYDQEIKTPVAKDKKKRKHNIKESNDVSYDHQDESYLQENQINNHSSKKRKSQILLEESMEKHDDIKLAESSEWTKEESKELLGIIKDMSNPNIKQSYKVTLNKLNFEKVADKLLCDKTIDNCKSQLQLLLSKINKVKTLHQVISEAMDSENVVNRKTAMDLFWEDNKEKVRSVAQQEKMNFLKARSHLWKELSEKERLYYQEKVETPKKTYKQKKVPEGEFITPVKSPFRIFLEKNRKKYPSSSFAESRTKYAKMDISKKIKFIIKSFETLYLEKEALETYSEQYPDKPPPKKITTNYPSHEEVKYYYHQHLELPEVPPKSVSMFAMSSKDLGSHSLIASSTEFSKLDDKDRQEWQIKFKKMWADYSEQLADWISRQDLRDIELMDKWPFLKHEKTLVDIKRKRKTVKKLKNEEKKKKVTVTKVLNEVVMSINIKKFKDEPVMPALSLMSVFENFLKKNGDPYEKANLMRKFNSLRESERVHIQEMVTYGRNKYIKRIKKYVNGLTEEMRKIYLGLRRKKLMNTLKEDIFEEIYPDEQYPVYVKQLTSSKVDVSEQKDISSPTKKSRRNLLPLEKDMLDIDPMSLNSLETKEVNDTIKSNASDSEELTTELSFESSPRKVKKRKMSLSPHKSKKKKIRKSSSSDFEEVTNNSHVELTTKLKKSVDSSTSLTKSPKKSITSTCESSSDSEYEVKSKLTPAKSPKCENSSSEEEEEEEEEDISDM